MLNNIIPNGNYGVKPQIVWTDREGDYELVYYPMVETTEGMKRVGDGISSRFQALNIAKTIMEEKSK